MRPGSVRREPRVPHHRRIAEEIGRRIAVGEYQPGSLLPSEEQLAIDFGVSRMTLRHGLQELASSGLIERRHGHGTLVAEHRFLRDAQRGFGLTEELAARGMTPGSHILSAEEARVADSEREDLHLGRRSRVVRIARLRYAGDVLIGYQETAIPLRSCQGLVDVNLEGLSLSQVLRERYGLRAVRAELKIEAAEANQELADLLGVRDGSALLRVTRTGFLADGRPVERTVGWYPGNRLVYYLEQNRGEADFVPLIQGPE